MSVEVNALLPAFTWLVAALLCLLLEAAGTPVGARKRGDRRHLPWVVGLGGLAVVLEAAVRWSQLAERVEGAHGVVLDRTGLFATALSAVLVVAGHSAATPSLRTMDEERGEMSAAFAVLGAAASVLCVASSVIPMVAALVLWVSVAGLLVAPDRDGPHGIEAAAKTVVGVGVVVLLLALAVLFGFAGSSTQSSDTSSVWRALGPVAASLPAASAVWIALALLVGAVPLHQASVDRTHGASPAAAALSAGIGTLAFGCIAVRLIEVERAAPSPWLADGGAALALMTLVGGPIAALDQPRVARVVAYLAVLPGGLMFAVVGSALGHPTLLEVQTAILTSATAGALAVVAAVVGLAVPALDPSSTWEDWSGFGRRRPVMAALFIYALGALVGVPGTVGFVARLDVARAAFRAGADGLGLVVVASIALGAAPIVRLALFLYAKDSPRRVASGRPAPAAGTALLAVFVVLVVVMVGLAAWPPALEALLISTRG